MKQKIECRNKTWYVRGDVILTWKIMDFLLTVTGTNFYSCGKELGLLPKNSMRNKYLNVKKKKRQNY